MAIVHPTGPPPPKCSIHYTLLLLTSFEINRHPLKAICNGLLKHFIVNKNLIFWSLSDLGWNKQPNRSSIYLLSGIIYLSILWRQTIFSCGRGLSNQWSENLSFSYISGCEMGGCVFQKGIQGFYPGKVGWNISTKIPNRHESYKNGKITCVQSQEIEHDQIVTRSDDHQLCEIPPRFW